MVDNEAAKGTTTYGPYWKAYERRDRIGAVVTFTAFAIFFLPYALEPGWQRVSAIAGGVALLTGAAATKKRLLCPRCHARWGVGRRKALDETCAGCGLRYGSGA